MHFVFFLVARKLTNRAWFSSFFPTIWLFNLVFWRECWRFGEFCAKSLFCGKNHPRFDIFDEAFFFFSWSNSDITKPNLTKTVERPEKGWFENSFFERVAYSKMALYVKKIERPPFSVLVTTKILTFFSTRSQPKPSIATGILNPRSKF